MGASALVLLTGLAVPGEPITRFSEGLPSDALAPTSGGQVPLEVHATARPYTLWARAASAGGDLPDPWVAGALATVEDRLAGPPARLSGPLPFQVLGPTGKPITEGPVLVAFDRHGLTSVVTCTEWLHVSAGANRVLPRACRRPASVELAVAAGVQTVTTDRALSTPTRLNPDAPTVGAAGRMSAGNDHVRGYLEVGSAAGDVVRDGAPLAGWAPQVGLGATARVWAGRAELDLDLGGALWLVGEPVPLGAAGLAARPLGRPYGLRCSVSWTPAWERPRVDVAYSLVIPVWRAPPWT